MRTLKEENITRELNVKTIRDYLGPFSIVSKIYEQEFDKRYGIKLKEIKYFSPSPLPEKLEKNVSFTEGYNPSEEKIKNRILEKYSSLPGFCSMEIKETKKLFKHVKKIYDISYSHYAWAKKTNLEGSFPNFCCGSSSRNILLTLMDRGYPNASMVYNGKKDHAYVVLPFILQKLEKKGFIIVDPTSDQLFNNKERAPRNNVFVIFGKKWPYKTDWANGNDLYPSEKDDATFANLSTLRRFPKSGVREEEKIEKYFKRVFKNPINLETLPMQNKKEKRKILRYMFPWNQH